MTTFASYFLRFTISLLLSTLYLVPNTYYLLPTKASVDVGNKSVLKELMLFLGQLYNVGSPFLANYLPTPRCSFNAVAGKSVNARHQPDLAD